MTNKKFTGPTNLPLLLSNGKVIFFKLYLFKFHKENYFVLEIGNVKNKQNVLTRIESACTYAHLFGSQRCDCRWQLNKSLVLLSKEKDGILIYALDQHGRGVGLEDHVRAYMLEETGLDSVEAVEKLDHSTDERNYSDILYILSHFKIKSIRLLTNNPSRLEYLSKNGIKVKRVAIECPLNEYNAPELIIKKTKMGHLYTFDLKRAIRIAKNGKMARISWLKETK